MIWIARVLGVLALGFAALGLFMTWVAQGQQYPIPLWNDQPWSGEARAAADWAAYGLAGLAGLALVFRPRAGAYLFVLALAVTAAKTGYDVLLGDLETARLKAMLRGDLILAALAAVAALAGFLTPAEPKSEPAPA